MHRIRKKKKTKKTHITYILCSFSLIFRGSIRIKLEARSTGLFRFVEQRLLDLIWGNIWFRRSSGSGSGSRSRSRRRGLSSASGDVVICLAVYVAVMKRRHGAFGGIISYGSRLLVESSRVDNRQSGMYSEELGEGGGIREGG